jgi:hypothetical protein
MKVPCLYLGATLFVFLIVTTIQNFISDGFLQSVQCTLRRYLGSFKNRPFLSLLLSNHLMLCDLSCCQRHKTNWKLQGIIITQRFKIPITFLLLNEIFLIFSQTLVRTKEICLFYYQAELNNKMASYTKDPKRFVIKIFFFFCVTDINWLTITLRDFCSCCTIESNYL